MNSANFLENFLKKYLKQNLTLAGFNFAKDLQMVILKENLIENTLYFS